MSESSALVNYNEESYSQFYTNYNDQIKRG